MGVVAFSLEQWFIEEGQAFSTPEAAVTVQGWLHEQEFRDLDTLDGLTLVMLPAGWPYGRKVMLMKMVDRLLQRPAAKKARGDGDAGEQPVFAVIDAGGGAQKPQKLKFVDLLDGERLPTTTLDKVAERAFAAQLAVRATSDRSRFRTLGLAPFYDKLMDGVALKQMAAEVISDLSVGKEKEAATEARQAFWGLRVFSTLLGSNVYGREGVLGRLLRGDWDKYKMGPLSLRDFHREGAFSVGARGKAEYSFVHRVMEALKSWALVMGAVFSTVFLGMTDEIADLLEKAHFGLAQWTQLRLYTLVNDAVADAIDDVKKAATGPGGGDIKGPEGVKAVFVYYLKGVDVSKGTDGLRDNEVFRTLREDLYSFDTPTEDKGGKAPPAPVMSGGGAKEAGANGVRETTMGKGTGRGTLCVMYLRQILGLRYQPTHYSRVSKGQPRAAELVKCHNRNCKLEHVVLKEHTKADLLARLEAEGVDVDKPDGYGAKIREALDKSTQLKK